MQKKSKAVVFVAMVYPYGGIRHFTLLANELFKADSPEYDIYYASITREADKGCWALARSIWPSERILEDATFDGLMAKVYDLASRYDKLLLHTGGGWGQTKTVLRVRRCFTHVIARRVLLMATTHSYQHDNWKRLPMSAFQYVLYRLFYRFVLFQCQYAADRFVGGNSLIRRGRGGIVPLGCEPLSEISDDTPAIIREKGQEHLLLDAGIFKFVYLAGYRPGKHHVWLVNAIAPVLKHHPEARLLLCGTGDLKVWQATERAIAANGVTSQVLMTGQIPRPAVPWLLKHSNAAAVASSAETFGHCFLEPMFAGLPVLGTRVGIGRDLIRDGETGYGFSLLDEQSFRDGAESMLSDPVRTRTMGRVAQQRVEAEFTHAEVAGQLTAVYERLLKE